jgi:hypothetical protein
VLALLTSFYAIPVWLLLALTILVAVALACAGQLLVRRIFPRADFSAHNEVAAIVLGIVGGLFGVTLAFIIAIVWQESDRTGQRVAVESGAASDLWHTSNGLPSPLGPEVRKNLVVYAHVLVAEEWPAMRHGESSTRAEQVLTRTYEDIARFRPRDAGASNAQLASLQFLGALHDARLQRLEDNNSGVSVFEWVVLVIGALIVTGLCYSVGFPSLRAALLMTGALAAMIAVMFVLIFELDYPFRGDLAIPPSGWQGFIERHPGGI